MRDELGLNELDSMADGDARAEKARRKLQQSELRAGELLSLGLAASSGTQSSHCEWCSNLHSHRSLQQAQQTGCRRVHWQLGLRPGCT